jgi:NADH-quinone oxidoreductase subunit J
MGSLFAFYGLAAVVVCLSIGVVTVKHPVTSIILLVFDLFFIAGIYAMQGADFAAVIQVIVYAGAIVVLFMFVIMLLDLEPHELKGKLKTSKIKKILLCFSLLGVSFVAYKLYQSVPSFVSQASATVDNTYDVAMVLFTRYLWPFELSSMLILLAVVASIIITKKVNSSKSEECND